MVEYTLVLELGQSNASPIGDIQGWEDNHPGYAIRSPQIDRDRILKFSAGSYRDDFTYSATFKGGPQISPIGATTQGDWQTVSLRGVAVDAVRVATFYNPSAVLNDTEVYGRSWPGVFNVTATDSANTGREFSTNFLVQTGRTSAAVTSASGATATASAGHSFVVGDIVVFKSGSNLGLATNGPFRVSAVAGNDFDLETWPGAVAVSMTHSSNATCFKVNSTVSPITITRKRTGATHTYAPTGLSYADGGRLIVDPPFSPPPDAGEEFVLTNNLQTQRTAASTTDPLVFDACLGGFVTNQSLPERELESLVTKASRYSWLVRSPNPLRKSRPVTLKTVDGFIPFVAPATFPAAATQDTGTILSRGTGNAADLLPDPSIDVREHLAVGDALTLTNAGASPFPSELTSGNTYYVVAVGEDYFQISEALGDSAISFGAATTAFNDLVQYDFASASSSEGVRKWPTRQLEPSVSSALTAAQAVDDVVVVTAVQEFAEGEKVRVSYAGTQSPPANLPAGDYYVVGVDVATTPGTERLSLSSSSGGSALTFSWSGVNANPVIERLDAYNGWLVSNVRDGADETTSVVYARTKSSKQVALFRGSISGLRIRCTSGANVGQWKHGKHISYDTIDLGYDTIDLCRVHFDGSWTATPGTDDVFVIEPTPVGSEDRPYEKFCQLLPWAPWEGQVEGSRVAGSQAVSISSGSVSQPIVVQGCKIPRGTSIKLYTTDSLPNGLVAGKRYYVTQSVGSSVYISSSYNGANLTQTADAGSGTHYVETADNDLGFNPHPPGFNYPNQFSLPRRYMPFDGYLQGSFYNEETKQEGAGVSAGLQTSFDLHNYTGRRSLLVSVPFGATSLAHREVHGNGTTNNEIFGWSDLNQQISWAPGEDNGCFARLLDVLDGVKLALAEEGSTVKDTLVLFNQGEQDAAAKYTADTYAQNLKQFKAAVRQALTDRGLASGTTERVKWLQNTIRDNAPWTYAATVNAAIESEALSDPYSRSLVGSDLEVFFEQPQFLGAGDVDPLHYHGTQMDLLGQRAFAAYQNLLRAGRSEIDICNLALANLGEQARVTSIDPSDGSREADLCAQFFDLARDQMLEKHAWDFALRSVTLTKRSSSPRVDYKCAYDYPDDVLSVLSVVRSDVDYNYKTMGNTGQKPYSVELDANGDRVLLTDEENALLLYVAKVTDSTKWSSLFVRALSWQLACHLAGPVLKGEEGMKMIQMCEQMADRTFRQATKHDGDHKRDVDTNDHVPIWQRHRSNRGYRY
ncbi:MAG: hypothetical protein ACO3O3_08030 [Ilumatobacteraceae bacterium]